MRGKGAAGALGTDSFKTGTSIYGDVARQCTICFRQSDQSKLRSPDVPADQKAGASLLIEVRSGSARVSRGHV